MFLEPHDTTINKGVKIDSIKDMLVRHYISTNGGKDGDTQLLPIQRFVHDDYYIYGLAAGPHIDPKPFVHPIQFNHGDDTILVIDIRSCTRYDRANGEAIINNQGLFRREQIRVLLQSVWEGEGANAILRLGNYQITVFATWIAEMIAKRYALDAEQQVNLGLVAAYYYLSLMSDGKEFDHTRAMILASRAMNVSVHYAQSIIGNLEYIADIIEFLKVAKEVAKTERLNGLDIDVLVTLLAGSWFGPNHTLIVGVALEHPPTFNTMLYLALTDRNNRSTGIGKIALRRERDPSAKEYVRLTSEVLESEAQI